MAIEIGARAVSGLRLLPPLHPQRARGGGHPPLRPRVPPQHGHLHRQAPPRDPQARQQVQDQSIRPSPRRQAHVRHHPDQEVPGQVLQLLPPRPGRPVRDRGRAEADRHRGEVEGGDVEEGEEIGSGEAGQAHDH